MKNMKRSIALVVAIALMVGCAIGGTMAWLIDDTDPVVNTFTTSDVDITLAETTGTEYQMIPGETITKDPTVTVSTDSEDCWLFVKVEESEDFDDYMTYSVITGDNGWTALGSSYPGVYYRSVAATDTERSFNVIYYDANNSGQYDDGEENKVFVNTTVTKDMMKAIKDGEADVPTLEFTAYAIQLANLTDQNSDNTVDATDAWALANPSTGA